MNPTALSAYLSKRAPSSEPRLHPELESIVLDNFQTLFQSQDLTWLWVGGRHVSKHFRCEIERIFRTVILPETILHCELGGFLRYGPQVSLQHAGMRLEQR